MAKGRYGEEYVQPGDNSKYLRHERTIMNWGDYDVESDEAVKERLDQYFDLCEENDIKPTVAGMALALRTTRATLWNWYTDKYRTGRSKVIKPYYEMLGALHEDYMANRKMDTVAGIFLAKNNFGYEDKKDVVVTANRQFENKELSAAEIRSKYLESAGATDEIETTGEIVE